MGFIGVTSIEDFGKIQIDRMVEMQQWADSINGAQKDERIRLAIVAANNHYAGFGPGTVNIFSPLGKKEKKNTWHTGLESNTTADILLGLFATRTILILKLRPYNIIICNIMWGAQVGVLYNSYSFVVSSNILALKSILAHPLFT